MRVLWSSFKYRLCEKTLFCCFSKNFVQTWISLRFLTCAKVLTCFYEFVEKNLEVVWKKEGNTSAAKLLPETFWVGKLPTFFRNWKSARISKKNEFWKLQRYNITHLKAFFNQWLSSTNIKIWVWQSVHMKLRFFQNQQHLQQELFSCSIRVVRSWFC